MLTWLREGWGWRTEPWLALCPQSTLLESADVSQKLLELEARPPFSAVLVPQLSFLALIH